MTVGSSRCKNSLRLVISNATSMRPLRPSAVSLLNSFSPASGPTYRSTYILTVAPALPVPLSRNTTLEPSSNNTTWPWFALTLLSMGSVYEKFETEAIL